jgi:hypothetical protein
MALTFSQSAEEQIIQLRIVLMAYLGQALERHYFPKLGLGCVMEQITTDGCFLRWGPQSQQCHQFPEERRRHSCLIVADHAALRERPDFIFL